MSLEGRHGISRTRRHLYREAKTTLHRLLRRRWRGTKARLGWRIRGWLRRRDANDLIGVVRDQVFALAVAASILAAWDARASEPINLADVAVGNGGFVMNGFDQNDKTGWGVSGAGDVNGDGLADIIVGAYRADPGAAHEAGESYVVFGKITTEVVELSELRLGVGGFSIKGISPGDMSGFDVSRAGDVNGDGLDDVIVSGHGADPIGLYLAGESYIVFGKVGTDAVDLSHIVAGIGGFVIQGAEAEDGAGVSVSDAGDVNGDGLSDVVIGARFGTPDGRQQAGESYIVFGRSTTEAVDLVDILAGYGGFAVFGIDPDDRAGFSVSGAGDVNGDGLDDVIVGAYAADPNGQESAGESYVVFGKTTTENVQLSDVAEGLGGFGIYGIAPGDDAGWTVSDGGDVNSDGLADVIVGARDASPGGVFEAGESYVIFGKISTDAVELSDVAAGFGGFSIWGIAEGDSAGTFLAATGDVNGDGLGDLIVGAGQADPGGEEDAGEAYVVFGKTTTEPVELINVSGGVGGFVMVGIEAGDRAGWGVGGAGDVNGDGLDDVIVGAHGAMHDGYNEVGEAYVVFSPEERPAVLPDSGSNNSGPCFIATAVYGTPLASELDSLRAFRDAFLLTHPAGSGIADTYYRVSPSAADWISRHERARWLMRLLLGIVSNGSNELRIGLVSLALLILGIRHPRLSCEPPHDRT